MTLTKEEWEALGHDALEIVKEFRAAEGKGLAGSWVLTIPELDRKILCVLDYLEGVQNWSKLQGECLRLNER